MTTNHSWDETMTQNHYKTGFFRHALDKHVLSHSLPITLLLNINKIMQEEVLTTVAVFREG